MHRFPLNLWRRHINPKNNHYAAGGSNIVTSNIFYLFNRVTGGPVPCMAARDTWKFRAQLFEQTINDLEMGNGFIRYVWGEHRLLSLFYFSIITWYISFTTSRSTKLLVGEPRKTATKTTWFGGKTIRHHWRRGSPYRISRIVRKPFKSISPNIGRFQVSFVYFSVPLMINGAFVWFEPKFVVQLNLIQLKMKPDSWYNIQV